MLSMPLAYPSALDRFTRPTWRGFGARRSHADRKKSELKPEQLGSSLFP
jgi:hypothetical protein